MTFKVIFAVEGGQEQGMGHVLYTTTLAKALPEEVETKFVTRSGKRTVQKIQDLGFQVDGVESWDEMIDVLRRTKPDTVVYDVPWIRLSDLRRIQNGLRAEAKLLVIANRNLNLPPGAEQYCDILVDFDIGGETSSESTGWEYNPATETLDLIGRRYLILREEFCERAEQKSETSKNSLDRVLLMFGGSDPGNLTTRVLKGLLDVQRSFQIRVILGPMFVHCDELSAVLEAHPEERSNVIIYQDTDSVAALMDLVDLVVTSPGLSMFESLALHTPVVALAHSKHQEIYLDYEFVFPSDAASDIADIAIETFRNFDTIFDDTQINVGKGKPELIRAILGEGPH